MKELFFKQKQIVFFGIAGALSAFVEVGLFKIFTVYLPLFFENEKNFHGVHFPLSNIFSTSSAIFTIWLVFERGKHSKRREFVYLMTVSVFSTILSLIFFQIFFSYIFIDHLDVGVFVFSREILSKISAILLVSFLNYSVKKKIFFNG